MSEKHFLISARDRGSRIEAATNRPVVSREWDAYPYIFLLQDKEPSYWQGKQILDVGSGQKFMDPENVFPAAKVHAIDPEFRKRIRSNSAHETKVGVVQEIPYDDNKFDLVVSSHAVPQHIFPVDLPRAISEMLRVMKPNGEIRIAPCVKGYDINPELKGKLEAAGFKVEFLDGGTDGTISRIYSSERLKNSVTEKNKAYCQFHQSVFPEEKLPYMKVS